MDFATNQKVGSSNLSGRTIPLDAKISPNPRRPEYSVDLSQFPIRIGPTGARGSRLRSMANKMDGLQNVTLSYGNVTQQEFEQFFGHAKANVLAGPGFD